MKKAVICLSGGLDSTVCFLWALKNCETFKVLFFNYGQKAYKQEKRVTSKLCKDYNIEMSEVDLRFLGEASDSSLNSSDKSIPVSQQINLNDLKTSQDTAKSVWVPNRNGLFINVAAAIAESLEYDEVIVGFNAEEAKTFPDNSSAFIKKTNEALKYSTKNKVSVSSPTLDLDKVGIFKLGLEYGMNSAQVWPCYFGEEEICGECESCKRFNRAKEACEI